MHALADLLHLTHFLSAAARSLVAAGEGGAEGQSQSDVFIDCFECGALLSWEELW